MYGRLQTKRFTRLTHTGSVPLVLLTPGPEAAGATPGLFFFPGPLRHYLLHILTGPLSIVKRIPVALSQTVSGTKNCLYGNQFFLVFPSSPPLRYYDALDPDTDELWGSVDVDWTGDTHTRRSHISVVLTA